MILYICNFPRHLLTTLSEFLTSSLLLSQSIEIKINYNNYTHIVAHSRYILLILIRFVYFLLWNLAPAGAWDWDAPLTCLPVRFGEGAWVEVSHWPPGVRYSAAAAAAAVAATYRPWGPAVSAGKLDTCSVDHHPICFNYDRAELCSPGVGNNATSRFLEQAQSLSSFVLYLLSF